MPIEGIMVAGIMALVAVGVGVVVYLVLYYVFKVEEVREDVGKGRKRLRR